MWLLPHSPCGVIFNQIVEQCKLNFFSTLTPYRSIVKGRSKPVQHFIQHFFCMFDEMLDEKLRVSYDKFSGLPIFIQQSMQHSNVHSFINSNSK